MGLRHGIAGAVCNPCVSLSNVGRVNRSEKTGNTSTRAKGIESTRVADALRDMAGQSGCEVAGSRFGNGAPAAGFARTLYSGRKAVESVTNVSLRDGGVGSETLLCQGHR